MKLRSIGLGPWLIAAILSAALVACGGDDDSSSSTSTGSNNASTGSSAGAQGNGDGVWKGEFETGTDVELTLWVDPSDPDLADFEAFREAAGANPVMYGRAVATNDGNASDTSRFATLTGDDGDLFGEEAIEVDFLCSHAARWIAGVATQTQELINQYGELLSGRCEGISVAGPTIDVGETVTYYVAYEGDSAPEFERIFMGVGNELKQ